MNHSPLPFQRDRIFSFLEVALIVGLALVPLFTTFPYRVNIFLSWEGAYRMSQGQVPYRDFGMPLGFMYWVIPAAFFKIFGPYLISLVKAQVLINIISGFAFRSMLKSLDVQPGVRFLSVFLYCISYSFFNFWPWYNHTVIVYQFVGIAFLLRYMFRRGKYPWWWLGGSALFIFLSFFTKQDGGALGFMLCCALLLYHSIHTKRWMPLLVFTGSFFLIAVLFIAPFTRFQFGYWFNHGQPPHTARLSIFEVLDEFLMGSQWLKFYLLLIVLLALGRFRTWQSFFADHKATVFLLLTLGIIAEATIFQVTSYTPPDNNIFFHAFAFAFILSTLSGNLNLDFSRIRNLVVGGLCLFLWWSGVFWKYVQRIAGRILPQTEAVAGTGENVVNRRTFMLIKDTLDIPMSEWGFSGLKAFDKVYMPRPTADGINRLMALPGVRNNPALKVLNMSELTPLAVELPYKLETGPEVPLWYHLGVGMFNREASMYETRLKNRHYDLVLFEHIPTLNNFYPFRVRDVLMSHYHRIDSFPAPRRGDTRGLIEVYRKP
jgi:ABC-type multidrug transport system fused ATPase/permease subunit